jgi:cobalt transporter subunit CbtB
MTAITPDAPQTTAAEVGVHVHVPLWTWFVMALALFGSYVMLQENGWIMSNWMMIHEFFHDGRHALGFPCH